jgi:maleate isomerase
MLGKIRRLGVLVPSSDSVTELDFKTFLPADVSFHTARLWHSDNTKRGHATLDAICNGIEPMAPTLVQVSPELIVFACTSGSFFNGDAWDDELERRIKAITGIRGIVTAKAVKLAFDTLKLKRAYMITPYPEEINRLELEYFSKRGIEITGHTYFHCEKSKEVSDILPQTILDRALQHADEIRSAGALFISCTGLRGMEVAAEAERQLKVPTVTSNSANIFAALRTLGIDTSGVAAGHLFQTPAVTYRVAG